MIDPEPPTSSPSSIVRNKIVHMVSLVMIRIMNMRSSLLVM